MICLAIVAGFAGLGCIMQMLAWCVETWKEGDREDKVRKFEKNSEMMSFEEFSKKMKDKETFKLGE